MDQPSTSGGERDEGSGAGASDLERLVGSQDILSLMFQQMAKNRKLTVLDDASTASTSRSPTFAARDWIACRLVCKQWKEMTEAYLFKEVCQSYNWRPPRRPRGNNALNAASKWTQLYLRHACSFCYELGEFPVRNSQSARNCTMLMLACKDCTSAPRVQDFLVAKGLSVDLVSLHGRPLLDKKRKKKRRRQ